MRTNRLFRSGRLVVLVLSITAVSGCGRNAKPDSGDARPRIVSSQRGIASFYGPGFHGEKTASGRRFDSRAMVAAHRTLPLGSWVRVTNLENGRSVVLHVIDRGPYVGRNTIIDVSEGAARRLAFVKEGRVRVKVDVLDVPRD